MTTRSSIAAVTAWVLLSLHVAAAQPCPPLQPRNPDGNYIVSGALGEIPFPDGLAFDAYVQPGGSTRPFVIVVHGGGWSSGSRVAYVGQLLELLTRAGYGWISIDYRLGGLDRYGEALTDLRAALEFVRCRATELRADPDRVILLGEEAGAHLAALLAAERPAGVVGAVLLGGYYDLAGVPELAARVDASVLAAASPARHLVKGMPDLLVVHGSADTEVPLAQARSYCRAAAGAGSRCELIEVQEASHRVENWWPSQWGYKEEIVRWLRARAPVSPPEKRTTASRLRKNIVYSEPRSLKLDAFTPEVTRPAPAAIIVHGGGWEAGDKVTYVTPLFEPLARAGIAWFSIDYRLTPAHTHAEQLEDVRDAIRFVRARHAEFGVDPSRLFLIGESASAQIVTQVATEDRGLSGVVAFYGVYDLPAMVTDASPRSLLVRLFRRTTLDDEARAVLRRHSPLYSAHRDLPPLLLITGTADRLWPQTVAFARRLSELQVEHEVLALEGAPHGLESWDGHPEWTVYKERLTEWIRRLANRAAKGSGH